MIKRKANILDCVIWVSLMFSVIFCMGCAYKCPGNIKTVMNISDEIRATTYYKSGQRVIKNNEGNCVAFSKEIKILSIASGISSKDIRYIKFKRGFKYHLAIKVKGSDGNWWIIPSTGVLGQYPIELNYYNKYMCNNFNNCWWVYKRNKPTFN